MVCQLGYRSSLVILTETTVLRTIQAFEEQPYQAFAAATLSATVFIKHIKRLHESGDRFFVVPRTVSKQPTE
jgi:hypothetical protein